ncbi:hypothetical protein D4764_09G0010130 [Takifugu flavidus]|uniref:Uncharacterized protein n=1 Tax=Takifugu flavidus TaxID=433684 RepID=A0A5C6MM76_9TELE|nr:hypothetical protein D4764_09G0010130 [Takifugu flavidus]
MTTTVTCICSKLCKNQRDLKIHQARMKCLEREVEVQRTGPGPANRRSEWLQFDEDVSNIIQATAKRDVDSRLQAISTIIVSYGSERFGRIEKGNTETTSYTMNRRSFKIHQLRKEL